MRITPPQLDAIRQRLVGSCVAIEIRPWTTTGNYIEVSQFARGARLIETTKIAPGGKVTVLS